LLLLSCDSLQVYLQTTLWKDFPTTTVEKGSLECLEVTTDTLSIIEVICFSNNSQLELEASQRNPSGHFCSLSEATRVEEHSSTVQGDRQELAAKGMDHRSLDSCFSGPE
jgi:hypothetical protein